MKLKSLIIIMLSVLAISIHTDAQTQKKDVNIKTVTFDVSMTCENCKKKIEKNIAFEKGIKDMQVSLDKKQVTLTFDTRKTNEEKIIQAFDKLGYNAAIVEEKS